ncbi:YggS family pyridoxal phosphate-dependent enzyme [Larkinella ripae]
MTIAANIQRIENQLPAPTKLIAVTKTKPVALLQEAYEAGCRRFGENKVQEMVEKQPLLPADLEWHLIGHLQTNKVKYIAPFVSLIHSVDSLKVLQEINKQAARHQRVIDCLLQIHIAQEETKFGFDETEAETLLNGADLEPLTSVRVVGLMGMATNTDDENRIRQEFRSLKQFYDRLSGLQRANVQFRELSMGMSSDYLIAIDEGSTMVRVGSAIFGARN